MRRRLMLLLSAVLLPIALAGISNEYRVRQERVHEVQADSLRTAQLVNADMTSLLQGTRNLLIAIATSPSLRELDQSRCGERLTELRTRFDRYVSMVVTDWDGMIVCSSGNAMPPGLIKDRPYLANARETSDFTVGTFTWTRGTQLPVLPLALPFRGIDGQWKGILVATLDLNWLSHHLAEIPNTNNAVIAVADRNGVLLARTLDASRYIGQPLMADALPLVAAPLPGVSESAGVDGVLRVLGYVPATVPPNGIFVAAGYNRAAAMRKVDTETLIEGLCILGAILLALFAGWLGSGKFAALQERMVARTAELEAERERRSHVETALAHSQKLEAVGQLTAGLAHDFNNLLAVVVGNLELARGRLRDRADIDRLLERAMSAADRGAGLTRQLLAFARNQKLSVEPADANQLIEGVQDLLERSAGPAVRIRLDLAAQAMPVLVDRGQLEVALLNLVLNARDAMPLGGTITLSTRETNAAELPIDLSPAEYVQIRVTDTGRGMPPEVKARAFEPFYTTKDVGKGSGLGLAQVFGIARQSGGTVTLDSEPGQGTVVAIYLPRSTAVPNELAEASRVAATPQLRRLRVMLVDDDPDVRSTAATMLRELNITVEEFDGGPAALVHLSLDPEFEVLITDFAMPDMTGAVLAERAIEMVPDLKVLLVTGFATGPSEEGFAWPVLKKPFRAADLELALLELTQPDNIVRFIQPVSRAGAGR